MYKVKLLITLSLLIPGLSFCVYETGDDYAPDTAMGFRPIYQSYESIIDLKMETPRSIEDAGKIYTYGDLLLVNERGKGVHIIDNHNPSQPQKKAFISIPGNVDLAVRENVLYADNYVDMVAIDLNELNEIKVLKRIKDAFPVQQYPPQGGYFECVEASQGVVVGWEQAEVSRYACLR